VWGLEILAKFALAAKRLEDSRIIVKAATTDASPSEAQPQTIARKGTRFSVNKKPAVLSTSLWRPRGADASIHEMESLFDRRGRCLKT